MGRYCKHSGKKVFDKNEKFAGKWIRELPYVVWSLRTQPSRALHGNTPFFMVYGSGAVLPADLRFGAPRLRQALKDEHVVYGIDEELLEEIAANKLYDKIFTDRKSTRLNSSHITRSRMPSSA